MLVTIIETHTEKVIGTFPVVLGRSDGARLLQ